MPEMESKKNKLNNRRNATRLGLFQTIVGA